MKQLIAILSLIGAMITGGCTSTTQSLLMNDVDVDQAIELMEAKDAKGCIHAKGTGGAVGVTGFVEAYVAVGKNLTYEACLGSFDKVRTRLREQ